MKNYTRIIITLLAIILMVGCGTRTQKNSRSLTEDTPPSAVTIPAVGATDEDPHHATPDGKDGTPSDTSSEEPLSEPPVVPKG